MADHVAVKAHLQGVAFYHLLGGSPLRPCSLLHWVIEEAEVNSIGSNHMDFRSITGLNCDVSHSINNGKIQHDRLL